MKFLNEEIIKNMEYCKEIMKLPNDDPKKREIINAKNGFRLGTLENVPIYFDPIYMRAQDQVMAIGCLNGDIVIDEKLLKLSFEGQIWNIYHELGHIKLNHSALYPDVNEYKQERKKFSKSGRVLPIEMEADNYCYERIGHDNFMIGIRDAITMADKCNRDVNEIDLRIKHFREKQK